MGLTLVPITQREAVAFVREHHRHHAPPRGGIFHAAVARDGKIVGVAIAGRPVARQLQDGFTLEVTRCCTDGTPNAPSMLYRACWRAARALGWQRLITYTLPSEGGASLRGAGFRVVGQTRAESWHRESRPRVDLYPQQEKLRWEMP